MTVATVLAHESNEDFKVTLDHASRSRYACLDFHKLSKLDIIP